MYYNYKSFLSSIERVETISFEWVAKVAIPNNTTKMFQLYYIYACYTCLCIYILIAKSLQCNEINKFAITLC